jgi:serine/threonine-protein kinase
MSPEQVRGEPSNIGPATDIYSLGAILYELLTGQPPFVGRSAMDTFAMHISQPPRPPRELNPAIPASLQTICLKCLEKDQARRYASAGALAEDLENFLQGSPIQASARAGSFWNRLAKHIGLPRRTGK